MTQNHHILVNGISSNIDLTDLLQLSEVNIVLYPWNVWETMVKKNGRKFWSSYSFASSFFTVFFISLMYRIILFHLLQRQKGSHKKFNFGTTHIILESRVIYDIIYYLITSIRQMIISLRLIIRTHCQYMIPQEHFDVTEFNSDVNHQPQMF